MSPRTRIWIAIASIVLIASSALVWSQYGEYDTRDIPSTFRIRAKTRDGYHVHAQVGYEHTRKIPILCYNPFSGYGGYTKEFDDIRLNGAIVSIKKSWPGLCKHEFKLLGIQCDKNGKWYDTAITSGTFSLSSDVMSPVVGKRLEMKKSGKETVFINCDFECDSRSSDFQLVKGSGGLDVVCREGE